MSRVANPWDWAYTANDAQTAVAGSDADAGQMGDIIKALIPYKDEYLIFGCANSIWVMRGDPASGGSLSAADSTVGIFGPKSWCFDGQGNLYFLSKDGLHVMPAGFGSIQPLSQTVLPNFAKDEHLDPTVHRVTMAYDSDRQGVLICINTVATGVNSNYFYDIRTQGTFPESYPSPCAPYSMFYYNASDYTTRGLIIGCKDGFIRYFNESEKNDVSTVADATITSEVVLPIMQNDDDDRELRIKSFTVTTAGGATGGTESHTDGVTINMFAGTDAETVLEAIEDGATPVVTTSVSGPGRQHRIRSRVRGHTVAVELKNTTSDSTWAIERVSAEIEPAGKVKS
jgi:hypothetical protein